MIKTYRVRHHVSVLGWVDFDLGYSTLCLVLLGLMPNGKLAELAEQVGKMVEHLRSKSTQPNYAPRWSTLYLESYPANSKKAYNGLKKGPKQEKVYRIPYLSLALAAAGARGVLQLWDGVIVGAGLGVGVVLLGGLLGRLVGQHFGELGHFEDCEMAVKIRQFYRLTLLLSDLVWLTWI